MNIADAVILVVTVLSCLFGLWRGLIREVLSLATWVAALAITYLYYERVAATLVDIIGNETARYAVAIVLLFVVVMLLGSLLSHLLANLLSLSGMAFTDKLLGGVFGVARGAVIVMVGIFLLRTTVEFAPETPWWQQSVLIPHGEAMIERSRMTLEESGIINSGSDPDDF